jgi:hypothetical protein
VQLGGVVAVDQQRAGRGAAANVRQAPLRAGSAASAADANFKRRLQGSMGGIHAREARVGAHQNKHGVWLDRCSKQLSLLPRRRLNSAPENRSSTIANDTALLLPWRGTASGELARVLLWGVCFRALVGLGGQN